jgi:hypothetical protein
MATRPTGIKVNVTSELIEDAIQRDSGHCMIAEAIKHKLPEASAVSVDIQTIRYSLRGQRSRFFFLTPRKVQETIISFDQGDLIEPFEFTLRQPHRTPMNISAPQEANKAGIATQRHGKKQPPLVKETTSMRGWPTVRIGRRRKFGLRALEQ